MTWESIWQCVPRSIRRLAILLAATLLLPLVTSTAWAQSFTTLHSFCSQPSCADGTFPQAGLVQATNGRLYGTTSGGGLHGAGTVFAMAPAGALSSLYSFCSQGGTSCTDGSEPVGSLIQGINGYLYGTTSGDLGNTGYGNVFKLTLGGTLTTLYSFCGQSNCTTKDLQDPQTGLVQASSGAFYGTTLYGGTSGHGTIFRMSPAGTLTTLHSFCSSGGGTCPDGHTPSTLIQATDGYFYGTTAGGGAYKRGTVFKMSLTGTLTTLYSFCSEGGTQCEDGYQPNAALIQAGNGDLYGTTSEGGSHAAGTVFKVGPTGELKTIYSFCSQLNCADGSLPSGPLLRATSGDLYGTTQQGGSNRYGSIFRITSNALTTVYSFCAQPHCADGAFPYAGVIQATNGNLYGNTSSGAANGFGTVFMLDVGLGPFIALQSTAGDPGSTVKILGTNVTGASGVTFNGTPATFTLNSSGTAITATVPVGATTGTVQVVTPNGSLKSNSVYTVM